MASKTLVLALFLVAMASGLLLRHEAALSAGTVNLKSDNGKYLSTCENCGPGAYPVSASVS